MPEDMDYPQAIEVLSTLVHLQGTPEECRAYLAVIEEVALLRRELGELKSRPRGMQIGDYGTQTNHF